MRIILLLLFLMSGALCGEDESELIFVYNAKSGMVNELLDFAHKIVSPSTYNCNLYAISSVIGAELRKKYCSKP